MRHWILLAMLVAGVALTGIGWAETLGPGAVTNGSFESGDDVPDGWGWATGSTATLTIDAAVAHSGTRSVRFHSQTPEAPNVYGGISQVVRGLAPHTNYLIRMWVKGKGVGLCCPSFVPPA